MDPKHGEVTLHRMAPAVGVLGFIGLIWFGAAYMTAGPQLQQALLQSYHWAFIFWMSLTMGCFGLTLLHHTIRPQWSLPLLRIFEAGGGPGSLFAMGVLFVPVVLGMDKVFVWTSELDNEIIKSKSWFLNKPMFLIVTIFVFVLWTTISWALRASSVREDESRDPVESQFRTNLSAPCLLLYFLSWTVAVTAWLMALDAKWYSTVFALLTAVGNALAALALAVVIFIAYHRKIPYSNVWNKALSRDHGNMLLALTMLWAYLTLSQFLIIWAANLREEVGYYVNRSHLGWNILGTIIILGQFFAPFLALCAPRTKHNPRLLILVAAGILIVRFLDSIWLVMPSLVGRASGFAMRWHDLVAFVGIGGIWLMVFAIQLGKARIFPVHDPRIREALEHARA